MKVSPQPLPPFTQRLRAWLPSRVPASGDSGQWHPCFRLRAWHCAGRWGPMNDMALEGWAPFPCHLCGCDHPLCKSLTDPRSTQWVLT